MRISYSNQPGNIVLWVILIVMIAAIFGIGGYYLGRWQTEKAASEETAKSQPITTRPAEPNTTATSESIEVSSPDENDLVSSPLTITGRAEAFENTITARLLDANGEVLAEKSIKTNAKDVGQFGDYTATLSFSAPATDTGTLEVFEQSAATGEPVGKVTVKVRFK